MAKIGTKPNGIHYLDVQIPTSDGGLRRARISCDTRDRREAEAQRRDWIAGVHPKHPQRGAVVAPKGRTLTDEGAFVVSKTSPSAKNNSGAMTVGQWLQHCLNDREVWGDPQKVRAQASVRSNAKILAEYVGDLPLGQVSSADVYALRDKLVEVGYSPATVKRKLDALRRALRHATDADPNGTIHLLVLPKFPEVVVKNIRERVVSQAEEEAIFEAINARLMAEPTRPWWHFKALVTILMDTGFRVGEALSLGQRSVRWKRWVDKQTDEIREATYLSLDRYATKSEKPREIPVTPRVADLIQQLNQRAVAGRWFPWKQRGSGVWYLWNNIRQDLAKKGYDLSDVRQHTFRHTCATRLAEGGMDLLGLRDWLGHSDISITAQRYIHLMSSHLYQGVGILTRAVGTSGGGSEKQMKDDALSTTRDIQQSGSERANAGTPVTLN